MYYSTTNLDGRRIIVGFEVLTVVVMKRYNAIFNGLRWL
jgi:hypothetical protein